MKLTVDLISSNLVSKRVPLHLFLIKNFLIVELAASFKLVVVGHFSIKSTTTEEVIGEFLNISKTTGCDFLSTAVN